MKSLRTGEPISIPMHWAVFVVRVLREPKRKSVTEQMLALPADTEAHRRRPLFQGKFMTIPKPSTLVLQQYHVSHNQTAQFNPSPIATHC